MKKMKVKSIFIQHAQTSPLFPPLRYDIALLWGQRDKRIYKSLNTFQCKLKIVGRPIDKTLIRFPKKNLIFKFFFLF